MTFGTVQIDYTAPDMTPETEALGKEIGRRLALKLDDMFIEALTGGRPAAPPHDGPTLETIRKETPNGRLYSIKQST